MENFKSVVDAFLENKLERDDLARQIEERLKQTPTESKDIKIYLTELHKANRLSSEDYSTLKAQIDKLTIPKPPSFSPSSGKSANTSSSGNQSSDSSTNQTAWQNSSQWEDSEEAVPKPRVSILGKYRLKKILGPGGMSLIFGGGIIIFLVAVAFLLKPYVQTHKTTEDNRSSKAEDKLTENPEVDSSSKVEEKPTENPEVHSSSKVEEKPTENPEVDSSSKVEEKPTETPEVNVSSKGEETSKEPARPIPDSTEKATKETQVALLLEQCKQHFDAGHLTMGNEGSTALACYREVLDLESSNRKALEGLLEIKARYVMGIDTALKHEQSKMEQRFEKHLKSVKDELENEVDVLVKECHNFEKAAKLDSALTCYRFVLKLDSDNSSAFYGIERILPIMEKVKAMLQTCQKHFEAVRLTTGDKNNNGNALDCYRDVLKLNSENAEVLPGLKRIEKRYEEWANKAFDENHLAKVEQYLKSLEKVDSLLKKIGSQSDVLLDIKQRLEETKAEK